MYDLDEDEEPLVIDQEQWQQGKPFCVAWVDLDIQYLKVSLICNTVISVATVYALYTPNCCHFVYVYKER